MTHPRAQIRHAIRARLAQPLPDGGFWTPAEDRVFTGRAPNLAQQELPVIVITAKEEEAEPIGVSDFNNGYERTMLVLVQCITLAWDDFETEDQLDAMALGVEQALDGLLVTDIETGRFAYVRTDIDIDREGETPIGAAQLTFRARYTTERIGVDFGLWDRDYPESCPAPGITTITLRSHVPQGSVDFDEMVILHGD